MQRFFAVRMHVRVLSHVKGFPEQRTSELASTFKDMERRRALGELGAFCDGFSGWTGWEQARLRVYVIEQEVSTVFDTSHSLTHISRGKQFLFRQIGITRSRTLQIV